MLLTYIVKIDCNGIFQLTYPTYPVLHCVGMASHQLWAHWQLLLIIDVMFPTIRKAIFLPGRKVAQFASLTRKIGRLMSPRTGIWCMCDCIVYKHANTSNGKYSKRGPHLMTILSWMKTSLITPIADHKGQSVAETCKWALQERCIKSIHSSTTVLGLKHMRTSRNTGTMWSRYKTSSLGKIM